MRQYVNLLGPAFRRQRQLLTLGRTVLLTAMTLLVMTAVTLYGEQQIRGLGGELVSAQGLLKAQNAYTDRLKGEGSAQKGNSGLDAEVQRLEMELKAARDSMAVLEGGAIGNRGGFAGYLQAFSRQALDGLWLTGFTVGGAGDVSLQGRVVAAELVPAYIQKLNREPALKGREFAVLEMRRPKEPVAVAAKEGDAKPEVPRFLEFSLTTAEAGAADAAGAKK